MWQSGDEHGLQSQVWSSNPGECKIINWGVRSRDRVRVRGSIRLGIGGSIGIGLGLVMSVLFFLRNTHPPQKKKEKKSGQVT